eukprot:1390424-Rhodomonas_salina.2
MTCRCIVLADADSCLLEACARFRSANSRMLGLDGFGEPLKQVRNRHDPASARFAGAFGRRESFRSSDGPPAQSSCNPAHTDIVETTQHTLTLRKRCAPQPSIAVMGARSGCSAALP